MNRMIQQHFDAIVVGTGPGGATVARELSRAKKQVLLLEWGAKPDIKGNFVQLATAAMNPGKGALFTPEGLVVFRSITTGGSSLSYYATILDPPYTELMRFGIDISDEADEVRKELPTAPLADNLIGPFARRIMESARELGYRWDPLKKFIYQDRCRPDCDKCVYGCPYGAKWNARMYAEEAMMSGTSLINGAKVTRVLIENGKAVGVEFKKAGEELQACAAKIVIAAGGIGSPVILRASGVKEAGYNFFFDPLIGIFGTIKDLKGGREIPMATGIHLEDDGYLMTDLNLPMPLYMAFTSEVFRFDRLFSHSRTLQVMVKAKDPLGGHLTDRGGVRKVLLPEDKRRLMHGCERAKKILTHAGAKNIFKTWYVAAHPGGTVKVGHLVDSNLRTEFENLYVCDSSVIPIAWGLPPVFTILCLAKRLAKHLLRD